MADINHCFIFLVTIILISQFAYSSSLYTNSTPGLCSHLETSALLHFKTTFIIDNFLASYECDYYYDDEGISTYAKTENWKVGSDCCSWDGVTCDELSGHVIKLDLSCSHLQGPIHYNSSLFQLRHLQTINLAFNDFTGSNMSSEFAKFPDLTHLNLSASSFSGVIPSQISNLSNLVSLDLSRNYQLEGHIPNSFANLTKLTTLDLSENDLDGPIPNSFANLTNLTHLDLSTNTLSGPISETVFSNLKQLQFLDLSWNYNLGGHGIPNSFSNLTKLYHLDLSFSFNELNLSGLLSSSFLSNLKQLEFLDLSQNNLDGPIPNSLANLTKLTHLGLSSNYLDGPIPNSLANLTKLTYLNLAYNKLSGRVSSAIFSNLNQLQRLFLSGNRLEGRIPNSFGNLKKLKVLHLDSNEFTGSLPSSFANLSQLIWLVISKNDLNGTIPSALLSLPLLEALDLNFNRFTGDVGGFQSKSLYRIDLSNNNLQGLNFSSNPVNLYWLNLASNNFTGTLELDRFTTFHSVDLSNNNIQAVNSSSNWVNLVDLNLASNNLSGTLDLDVLVGLRSIDLSYNRHLSLEEGNEAHSPFLNLTIFLMSNCNLTSFPLFLRNSVRLYKLDLSSNRIHGPFPEWLGDIGKTSLTYLNLSRNSLTSIFEILPWSYLVHLDLSFNSLEGPLPLLPSTLQNLFISNNKISGEIQPTICNMSQAFMIDMSSNNLSGKIPSCLLNTYALNLQRNNFSGTIPETFGYRLTKLYLSHNQLEGHIPQSLANCTTLKILDLGYNIISGTFPSWMETMPELKILILRANRLHGSIGEPKHASGFTKLKIIDLSYNKFSGNLPSHYFRIWKSMTLINDEDEDSGGMYANYYSDLVTLSNKGTLMELAQNLKFFKAVDFSNNKFDGKIPESISHLSSLVTLNLSSNSLTGEIPPSMGNLVQLGSLDLSNNKLSGEIPEELNKLTSLGVFDVSQNNLEGSIPQGGHMITFPDAYKGNPGLCGIPLPKKCQEIPAQHSPPEQDRRSSDSIWGDFTWESVAIGYGSGAIIGIVIGNMIIRRNEEWVLSIFNIRVIWRIKISSEVRRE